MEETQKLCTALLSCVPIEVAWDDYTHERVNQLLQDIRSDMKREIERNGDGKLGHEAQLCIEVGRLMRQVGNLLNEP